MDPEPFALWFILHRFPELKFSMGSLDDRVRLQKFVYLLQAHGVYLGYDFSWYTRGPYCSGLAKDGFILEGKHDDAEGAQQAAGRFDNALVRARLDKFAEFVKGRERDLPFLEAAASLHHMYAPELGIDAEEATKEVAARTQDVDESYARRVFDDMMKSGLLPQTGPD